MDKQDFEKVAYDLKDWRIIHALRWARRNPNKITFNPAYAEAQNIYKSMLYWTKFKVWFSAKEQRKLDVMFLGWLLLMLTLALFVLILSGNAPTL